MAKILLVVPRVDYRPQPPLGICYIAASLLQQGHNVQIFDPVAKFTENDFPKVFKQFVPDLVGISSTTPHWEKTLEYAKKVKTLLPSCPIVIGGAHPTVLPEKVLQEQVVDYAVIGEGEGTIVELINYIITTQPSIEKILGLGYKANGKIFINPNRNYIEDLDSIPFPARHLLNMDWYSRRLSIIRGKWLRSGTIIASRGCPFPCAFCSGNKILGKRVRRRTPQNVILEAKEIVEAKKLEGILFVDDTMTLDKEWIRELCQRWKKELPNVIWAAQGNIGTIDHQMIRTMVDGGCVQLEFGVESGSPDSLARISKKQTLEQIEETFRICREAGIRSMANFIIGIPGETLKDIEMTRQLAQKIRADYSEFFILTPYPGTAIYSLSEKLGILKDGKAFFSYESSQPIIEDKIPRKELVHLRQRLYEDCLFGTTRDYLFNYNFMYDVFTHTMLHPKEIFNYFKILFKTRSVGAVGRHLNKILQERS